MSTVTVNQHGISPAAVRALKGAESICCHHVAGESFFAVYISEGTRDRLEIKVGHEFTDYQKYPDGRPYKWDGVAGAFECFESLYGFRYDDGLVYHAIRAIRPGDLLTLHWIRGNTSETMESVNIIQDAVHLIIRRPGKDGTVKKVGVFHLGDSITKSDSLARMIRPARS